MEHDQIKNGTTVAFTLGSIDKIGEVKSYNPRGPGIFTVEVAGQRHPYYLYEAEVTPVKDPAVSKTHRIKRAEQLILEAACENPLRTNGPYVLADNNAAKFVNAIRKALLELTAEDNPGKV